MSERGTGPTMELGRAEKISSDSTTSTGFTKAIIDLKAYGYLWSPTGRAREK